MGQLPAMRDDAVAKVKFIGI